jgi:hypothetical protein
VWAGERRRRKQDIYGSAGARTKSEKQREGSAGEKLVGAGTTHVRGSCSDRTRSRCRSVAVTCIIFWATAGTTRSPEIASILYHATLIYGPPLCATLSSFVSDEYTVHVQMKAATTSLLVFECAKLVGMYVCMCVCIIVMFVDCRVKTDPLF